MRRISVLTLALLIAMSSIAAASIDCPCRRPGAAGVVTKFVAREGTTTNVTLYPDLEKPEVGDTLTVVAGKAMGGDVVIIENLSISEYLGPAKIDEKWTDLTGEARFRILAPGSYELRGGDYALKFEVLDIEEAVPVNSSGEGNQTTAEGNGTPEAAENITAPPAPAAPAKAESSSPTFFYEQLIAAAIVAVFAIIYLRSRKKSKKPPKPLGPKEK
jgi:hypothetical protein